MSDSGSFTYNIPDDKSQAVQEFINIAKDLIELNGKLDVNKVIVRAFYNEPPVHERKYVTQATFKNITDERTFKLWIRDNLNLITDHGKRTMPIDSEALMEFVTEFKIAYDIVYQFTSEPLPAEKMIEKINQLMSDFGIPFEFVTFRFNQEYGKTDEYSIRPTSFSVKEIKED